MSDEDIKKSLFEIAEKAANQDDIYFDGHASTELSKLLHNTLALINRQQDRIEELEIITGLANNRKYYRKFVDEIFCKQEGNELSEPDFDYIYQLYFEQQAEIDDLKRDTVPKLQDSLNRANKYGRATDRENARLKAEIERLNSLYVSLGTDSLGNDADVKLKYIYDLETKLEAIKSEAIKECVNKYTEMLIDEYRLRTGWQIANIKRLEQKVLAKMAGEQNV